MTSLLFSQDLIRKREAKKGARYYRAILQKIELISKLMEIEPMKIYRVDYFVKCKVNGHHGWTEITGEVNVSTNSVERAIESAKRHALASTTFYNDELKKKETERYKDFELKEVKLIAESDVRG